MKRNILFILQRTAVLLIITAVLSAIVTGLNVIGLMTTKLTILLSLTACAIIVTIINIRSSRNSFFILRNIPLYYMINGAAFVLYMLILFATYKIGGNIIFTWLFSVTKFTSYINANITTELALLFFGFVQLLVIAVSPLGMSFLFMYHENNHEENEL